MYGPALLDHVLQCAGFPENAKLGKDFNIADGNKCLSLKYQMLVVNYAACWKRVSSTDTAG